MSTPRIRNGTNRAPQLSEHVARNVNAVKDIHAEAERTRDRHQRAIESGTAFLGRPASLYVTVAFVSFWIGSSVVAGWLHMRPFDGWPFAGLQGIVSLAGLLTSIMVLITQNRQARLMERRMHLDLQVNLVTEQKTAKLIELVEELRRDLPDVPDRLDAEAEAMKQSAEPKQVLEALDEQTGLSPEPPSRR
jgi:uncharacterized membrane protein